MKFREGDKVVIIDNIMGHEFNIGDEVTITDSDDGHQDYMATDGYNEFYVCDDEIEEVIE